MKNVLMFIVGLFLSLTSLGNVSDSLEIQVTGANGEPLMDVLVLQLPESYLLGSTTEDGYFRIDRSLLLPEKTVVFQHIGYEPIEISVARLLSLSKLEMKERIIELEASDASVHALPDLLKECYLQTSKFHKGKSNYLRYYGEADYARCIIANSQIIHLRQEHGLFMTSGNCQKKEKWDLAYIAELIPEQKAYSFQLTSDAQDTLKHEELYSNTNWAKCYNIQSDKLHKIMRLIYLHGPMFDSPEHFRFRMVDIDSNAYTLQFETNRKYWPSKTKLYAKGILKIDRHTLRLTSMDLESVDMQYFVLVNHKRYIESPCAVSAQAYFDYSEDGHAYISECYTTVQWKKNCSRSKEVYGLYPPRAYPGKCNLVEKEYWKCGKYGNVPEKYRKEETAVQARSASVGPVPYSAEYFQQHPNPFVNNENTRALEKYMPLAEQYMKHSGRNIYHLSSVYKSLLAKKILFGNFFK